MKLNPSQNSRKYIFVILAFLWFHTVSAQVQPSLGGSSRIMNSAMEQMENGDYEKANASFRKIIDSNLPIPPEMPYYFAETLYHLEQFDNSANFLNKYLELNGFKGDNYEKAKALEKLLENHLNAIKACGLCDRRGYRYQECFTCEGTKHLEQDCNYCKAKGIVGCSKCVGSGLITRRNVFNIIEYFECERCEGHGRLTCPTCEGSKLETSACRTCQGSGHLQSDKICDHKEEPRHLSQVFNRLKPH
ncbi:molecular chaperone DnaJ [Belliella marina]|uniref:Molecular chaperone DnaJ n=1 Tax=Belliella marina TaxID=1644146 RepID=A0ABW4VQH8_9BACT